MKLEKPSMADLVMKLTEIGGAGKFEVREHRIKSRLGWRTKAKSAIRHMLNGERKIDLDEAREIEIAHFKWCAEKAAANAEENKKLFASMRSALEAMEVADAEFYGPQIEAVGAMLLQHRDQARENG